MDALTVTAWRAALRKLVAHDPKVIAFCQPIAAPEYLAEVEKPMDLSTIDKRLCATGNALGMKDLQGAFRAQVAQEGLDVYVNNREVAEDVELVMSNCRKYNGEDSVMGELASELSQLARRLVLEWVANRQTRPWESEQLPTAPWDAPKPGAGEHMPRSSSLTVQTSGVKSRAESESSASSVSSSGSSTGGPAAATPAAGVAMAAFAGAGKGARSVEDEDDDVADSDTAESESSNESSSDSGDSSASMSDSEDDDTGASHAEDGAEAHNKPKSSGKKKRPIPRGVEIEFTCDALKPEFKDNAKGEFASHFEKIMDIMAWVDRVCPGKKAIMERWQIEIYRRLRGATKGTLESCLVTPEFKRLRSRKDVAGYLGLSAEDECSQEAAFAVALRDQSALFQDPSPSDPVSDEDLGEALAGKVGVKRRLLEPLRLDPVTVHDLGRVVNLPRFCTKKHVYPLGFTSTCQFFSPRAPGKMTTYRNEVLLAPNKSTPLFRVTDVSEGVSTEGRSPTIAWTLMSVKILLGMHKYWEDQALSVTVSERICAINLLPSNASRALAKTEDESKKMELIRAEVRKVLATVLKKVETNVSRELSTAAAAAKIGSLATQGQSPTAGTAGAAPAVAPDGAEGSVAAVAAAAAGAAVGGDVSSGVDPADAATGDEVPANGTATPTTTDGSRPGTPTRVDSASVANEGQNKNVPSGRIDPKARRQKVQLRDLIRIGKLPESGGVLKIEYQGNQFEGELLPSGQIKHEGTIFDAPSTFSITMKRQVNPSKMADDGWRSCHYMSESLYKLRRSLSDEDLERIQQMRIKHGEDIEPLSPRDLVRINGGRSPASGGSKSGAAGGGTGGVVDALEDRLEGKGIGERNYLAGAPDLHLLPQPHQIQWWQVDLTPLINEQLGKYLFGIDHPEVLDAVEALPMMDRVKSYRFRVQRGSKTKEDVRLTKRNIMLAGRTTKAVNRILKHQDAVDRRLEAAARRHMRIEDRLARNWRVQMKKMDREAAVASRREDRDLRFKEKQSALESLRSLRQEIAAHRDLAVQDNKASELDRVRIELETERNSESVLQAEFDKALEQLRKLQSAGVSSTERTFSEASSNVRKARDQLDRQRAKVQALDQREARLARIEGEKEARDGRSAEAETQRDLALYRELESTSGDIERYLRASAAADDLPDDLSLLHKSPDLAVDTMESISTRPELGEPVIEVWDFLSKFGPDLGLCEKPELMEGMYNPEQEDDGSTSADALRDDGDADGNEDDDEDEGEDEDEDDEDDEDYMDGDQDGGDQDGDAEGADKKAKKKVAGKAQKKAGTPGGSAIAVTPMAGASGSGNGNPSSEPKRKRPKKRARPVLAEAPERTPVILLPEVKRAIEQCDMVLLGPVHVSLLEFLFLGETTADLSDAAKDRSLSARRYVPVNEATWQEVLRYYLMFLVKKVQTGLENTSIKETLQGVDNSVNSLMTRAVDGREEDLDDEDEDLTQNARRVARRNYKLKLIACREVAMRSVVQRLRGLAGAPYSGSESAELLLSFPSQDMIENRHVYVPPAALTSGSLATNSRAPSTAVGSATKGKSTTKTASLVPVPIAKMSIEEMDALPEWGRILVHIRDMPTNRGSRIRNTITKAIELMPPGKAFEDSAAELRKTIKSGVFKSNAAGPSKRVALAVVMEHLSEYIKHKEEEPEPLLPVAPATPSGGTKKRSRKRKSDGAGAPTPAKPRPMAKEDLVEMTPELRQRCRAVARALSSEPQAVIFCEPVDTATFTDYLNYVTEPMDLRTIDYRVARGHYELVGHFVQDLDLVWRNCKAYNQRGSEIYKLAARMATAAKALVRSWVHQEPRAAKLNPFVYDASLPDAPWPVQEPEGLDDAARRTPGAESEARSRKRKREKASAKSYELSEAHAARGFVVEGKHVGARMARREEGDDAFERGTIVAYADAIGRWLIKYDDDGEEAELEEAELSKGFDTYSSYVASKKSRRKKKKKKKSKSKHRRSSASVAADEDDDDDDDDDDADADADDPGDKKESTSTPGQPLAEAEAEASTPPTAAQAENTEAGGAPAAASPVKVEAQAVKVEDTPAVKTEAVAVAAQPDKVETAAAAATAAAVAAATVAPASDGAAPMKTEHADSETPAIKMEVDTAATAAAAAPESKKRKEPEQRLGEIKSETKRPKPESPPTPRRLLRLDAFPDYAMVGGIVTKWYENLGCIEGVVTEYNEELRRFTVEFPENGMRESMDRAEVEEAERRSAVLKVGSDRNGVEDEAKELERIEAIDHTRQRCYRRIKPKKTGTAADDEEDDDDDDDDKPPPPVVNSEEVIGDQLAPPLVAKNKELAVLRRVVVALGTQRYEDISPELKASLLRILCEQVAESGTLREVVERRLLITVKTRQKWRDLPPIIKRVQRGGKAEDAEAAGEDGILDRLAGEGIAEQAELQKRLSEFRTKRPNVSKNLARAIERVERDLEKQQKKKQLKEDARRWKAELEYKLQMVSLRPRMLGLDRYFNRYMLFPGDGSKLFVHISPHCVQHGALPPDACGWRVVWGRRRLNKLLASLNPAGVREAALLHAIQSRSSIFVRGERAAALWKQTGSEAAEAAAESAAGKDDANGATAGAEPVMSLVGKQLKGAGKDGNLINKTPGRFYRESVAGSLLGPEVVERHLKAAEDASPESMRSGGYTDKALMDIKMFLLNMEYAVLMTRLDEPLSSWMSGLRNGWLRLVSSATEWRDLRQACCAFELALHEVSVPLENWYVNMYGDAGFALRTRTCSSLASRVTALDSAINHAELARQAVLRTNANAANGNLGKRRSKKKKR